MYYEYLRLTENEKNCYQKLLKEAKEFKTRFQFFGTPTETITKAFHAMLSDHPEIFWLSGEAEIEATFADQVIEDATLCAELLPGMDLSTVPMMAQVFESAVETVIARAKLCTTTFLQVLAVHDYLIDTTKYDKKNPYRYNAYGCLVQNRAVCSGYSKAFMLIMNHLGYPCGYAAGILKASGESHAWNFIELDGEFYHIDVTNGDPTDINAEYGNKNKIRDYFCLTTDELKETHEISDDFYVPYCGGTKYNYYNYKNLLLQHYSFEAVSALAAPILEKSGKFSVKFSTKAEADRAFADLIKHDKIYTIPGICRNMHCFRGGNGRILTVEND